MSSETYAIVFKGDILDGHDLPTVKLELAKLLKLKPDKIETLFSGKPVIIKKYTDKAEAARYGRALKRTGADVKLRLIRQTEPVMAAESARESTTTVTAQPDTEATPATDALADATLAPNIGNLFEPLPAADAPDLDLSRYSLADNDGSFIIEPTPRVKADIDLTAFSVADNDGSDLFETAPAITADISIPDYGLDEPGALLETLEEDQKILQPNTLSMTLAMTGADLLDADEKPAEPAPEVPDTSRINLVPNFDL